MDRKIHKELEEIAPVLASCDQENPFRVPSEYFENLNIKAGTDLKMTVPDGYFDKLHGRIMDRVEIMDIEEGEHDASIRNEPKKLKYIIFKPWSIGIAASICLLIASVFLLNDEVSIEDEFVDMDFETAEMIAYIEIHDVEFGDDLYHLMDVERSEVLEFSDKISDEELEGYMDDMDWSDLEEL